MADTWRGLGRSARNIVRRPSNVAGIAAGLGVGTATYFLGREVADYLANGFLSTTVGYLDWVRNSVEFARNYGPPATAVTLGGYAGWRVRNPIRSALRRTR